MNTYQSPDRRERKVSMEETGYNVHTATVTSFSFVWVYSLSACGTTLQRSANQLTVTKCLKYFRKLVYLRITIPACGKTY